MDTLVTALASRASTVRELAELTLTSVDDVRDRLELLEQLGYLEVTGERISYRSPELAITERAEELLQHTSSLIDEHLQQAKDLLTATPRVLAGWYEGSLRQSGTHSQTLHGTFAPTELWMQLAARGHIRSIDGILPDASPMLAPDGPARRLWREALVGKGIQLRAILASADVRTAESAAAIGADIPLGAEFRMLPEPPSWLWVADDETVGLPLRWADPWPMTVVATSDPAVVALVRWLYDHLWAQAVPVMADEKSWEPLLALMSRGDTLESASRALGISTRTGRRRLTAAHEHFGTDGMFELGVAWQQTRGSTAPQSSSPAASSSV